MGFKGKYLQIGKIIYGSNKVTGNRTQKVVLNTSITLMCQIVYLIVSFICRTVFTKTLGAEYLGISGLFSNILTILNFAELGIGSALVYRMYEPLAKQDYETICEYMQLYKTTYRIIAIIILLIGFSLIPFIPLVVTAPDIKEDIVFLFVLYLLQTVTSYICVYKKSILIADQKSYLVNIYTQIFNIGMNIAQCVLLVVTHDFVIYCVLNIVFNLANNVICSQRANKEYPYIKQRPNTKLNNDEIKGLIKDVKGLLMTKIADTVLGGTDNIFIAAFIGIRYVGVLSNYTVFSTIINSIMNKIFSAVTATIGNLVVTGEKNKTEAVLKKLFFLNTSMYGYLCLVMLCLLREFIVNIWLDVEYSISQTMIALILIELFLRSIHYPLYIVRNAMGCFSEYKNLFVVAAVLNIILDYVLIGPLGINGLYLATIFCRGITYLVDIWVVYHQQLHLFMVDYLRMVFKWLVFLAGSGYVMSKVSAMILATGIANFIMRGVVISLIYFVLFFIIFCHSEEFKYYISLGRNLFLKKREDK